MQKEEEGDSEILEYQGDVKQGHHSGVRRITVLSHLVKSNFNQFTISE